MTAPAGATVQGRVERDGFTLDAELSIEAGELVSVVGPNGSGKTTLLRVLAGLTPLTDGTTTIDGSVVDGVADGVWAGPEDRPIGFVFDDRRLFASLDVLDNVAFGLRARGVRKAAARQTARDWLTHLGAAHLAQRSPAALSAGESQRVALARALAPAPALLLLDEPFSALDEPSRQWMRRALDTSTPETGPTSGPTSGQSPTVVVVTHDTAEALALGSRTVVLEAGGIVHDGRPDEIARRPRSSYAAALVGVNVFQGTARNGTVTLSNGFELYTASAATGPVTAIVNPRAVGLFEERPTGTPRNVLETVVEGLDVEERRARVRLRGPVPLIAEVTPSAVDDLGISPGRRFWIAIKATEIDVRGR